MRKSRPRFKFIKRQDGKERATVHAVLHLTQEQIDFLLEGIKFRDANPESSLEFNTQIALHFYEGMRVAKSFHEED